jgi:antitoxin component YwqK of YwqJK toxin-antitoxin module
VSPAPPQPSVGKVRTYEEHDASGRLRARWSAGVATDGRYLLHGTETWYYPNGHRQWTARYDRGRKVGPETLWREDGSRLWTWDHRKDGTHVWTGYWPNGQKHTESTWRDHRAEGVATAWDASGKVVGQVTFAEGKPKE